MLSVHTPPAPRAQTVKCAPSQPAPRQRVGGGDAARHHGARAERAAAAARPDARADPARAGPRGRRAAGQRRAQARAQRQRPARPRALGGPGPRPSRGAPPFRTLVVAIVYF